MIEPVNQKSFLSNLWTQRILVSVAVFTTLFLIGMGIAFPKIGAQTVVILWLVFMGALAYLTGLIEITSRIKIWAMDRYGEFPGLLLALLFTLFELGTTILIIRLLTG